MHKEIDELRRNTQIYFRRFKKEKRYRRKLQEQLEQETRRRVQMEEALRVTSADTLKRITESLAKEMEHQKRLRNTTDQDETGLSVRSSKQIITCLKTWILHHRAYFHPSILHKT